MDYKEILERKLKWYGETEAAYEFAAEEHAERFSQETMKNINERLCDIHGAAFLNMPTGNVDAFEMTKFAAGLMTNISGLIDSLNDQIKASENKLKPINKKSQ